MVVAVTLIIVAFSILITTTALIIFQGYVDVLGLSICIAAPVLILPLPARSFFAMYVRIQKTEEKLRTQNQELEKSLEQIKVLSGLLPICCNCKKIRDDEGYWSEIEQYFNSHSDLQLTHGICPECVMKLYPELYPKGHLETNPL
jgi:hypothetical protein